MTETPQQQDFVEVHTLTNRFEADVLERVLRDEGIAVIIRSHQDTAYDGIFVAQLGWGRLSVPADQVDRAKALIEATTAAIGDGRADEDET